MGTGCCKNERVSVDGIKGCSVKKYVTSGNDRLAICGSNSRAHY